MRIASLVVLATLVAGPANAEPVQVYAAGSLRGVVEDLGKGAKTVLGVEVKGQFGGSGSMRERIEKGEAADLLMSADMNSPLKLEGEGKTVVPVIAFARNRECVVSRKAVGITPANLIAKFTDKAVRVKTSQPIADPSGDYAFAIFDKMDVAKPGSGAVLKAKAQGLMDAKATPTAAGQSALAALFAANQIDATIVYCSAAVDKELPDLTSFPAPAAFDPHPVYGVAVLSTKPDAMRLALYLLSEKGQAIIAKNGLVPLRAETH